MKGLTIRSKTLLITLIPLVFSICLLSGYYSSVLIEEIKLELHIRGQAIADHMAPSCEYTVISGNKEELEPLIDATLREQSLIKVVILDQERKIFIEKEHLLAHVHAENRHTFTTPIMLGAIDIGSELDGSTEKAQKIIGYVEVTLHDLSIVKKIQATIRKVIYFSVVLMLFFSLLAIWAAHRLTKPMEELTHTVKAIGEGKLNISFSRKSGGEMGALENGIESMAQRLVLAKENEKTHYDQLARSREIAEIANLAKGEFLSRMSHELRTPLHGMMGLITQMESTTLNADQQALVIKASIVAQDFSHIVDDILDFSNLETGKWKMRHEQYAPGEILNSIYQEYKNRALQKGLSFRVDHTPKALEMVTGDPVLFKKVIQLLVDNAVKFTAKGYVMLKLSYIGDGCKTARISIIDTGPGISMTQQDYIFEPFYQVESSLDRAHSGCGLGLSLANRILGSLNSHLNIKSGEGEGTTFWFDLHYPLELLETDKK